MLRQLFFIIRYFFFRPPWDTGRSPPELLEILDREPPGKALDLGCGTGTNALTMARNGWDVTGVDIAPNAVSVARRKARRVGLEVEFRVGDVVNMPAGAPFDLVLDVGCLHSLKPARRVSYIENFPGLLRPEGLYLLYTNLHTPEAASRSGLEPGDLELLGTRLRLIQREDGTNRGIQPSAWLTYRHVSERDGSSGELPERTGTPDPSNAAREVWPRKR